MAGNLRELKNVIKRAALLTDGDTIVTKALPMEISTVKYAFPDIHPRMTGIGNTPVATVPNLKSISLEAEYEMIMSVLKQVNFNRTKAAKILNIDRKTLYNKMKALNI
jgi:two-component system, NtrC family, response regulator HydG